MAAALSPKGSWSGLPRRRKLTCQYQAFFFAFMWLMAYMRSSYDLRANRIASWILGLCLALVLTPSTAATLAGRVVAVADGDTLIILVGQQQIKVRLADIDAPERGQAFGARARQSLIELCHRQRATVADRGRDRYGRSIARVTCAGKDANAEQVRRGMAWVFDRYARRTRCYMQYRRTHARRGLRVNKQPVPPW